eukprot:4565206-Amphidinium_carterae.1
MAHLIHTVTTGSACTMLQDTPSKETAFHTGTVHNKMSNMMPATAQAHAHACEHTDTNTDFLGF